MGRARLRPALVSLLVAVGLTCLALPEVVFLGGSLSHVGLNDVVESGAGSEVSLYPDPEGRSARSGMIDIGARAWQLDPATKFMNRTLYDGDSPAWNPYSASGSLGTETLADMKLSPVVLTTAALGASSTAFTIVLLAFIVGALYCVQQLFTRSLHMHRLAAVAACVVFLIGGWATAMFTGQMGAPYLLFPIVLYTVVEFLRRTGPARLVVAVAAYAGLLLTTFLPVVLLMVLFVHAVALVIDATARADVDRDRPLVARVPRLLGRQAIVPVLAFSATAFMWLPLLDAYRDSGDELSRYSSRALDAREPIELLSLLTPRHLFRSYLFWNVATEARQYEQTIYLGMAPLLVIAGALPRSSKLARRLLILLVVLGVVAVVQHMGVPGLSVIGGLPGLRAVSAVYWASMAAAALTVAVGVAIDTAMRAGLSWKPMVGVGIVFALGLGAGVVAEWRPSGVALLSVAIAIATIVVVIALVWCFRDQPQRLSLVATLAVVLIAAELFSYQNHTRVTRFDYEDDPPAYLTFVQDNLGDGRVLSAGRDALYPEWGAAFGIRQVETLNMMQVPEYREFFDRRVNPEEGGNFLQIGGDPGIDFGADPAALDQLSVRYIIVGDLMSNYGEGVELDHPLVFEDDATGVRVYENPDAFPRAYLSPVLAGGRSGRQDGPRWTMQRTFTADAELLDAAHEAGVPIDGEARAGGEVEVVDERNTRVRVEVEAEQPAVLVLTDSFHDNWSVSVNGEPAHLGRVNEVVRGVVVPAGESIVEFRYESRARTVGTLISVLTIVALLLGAAVWAVVRRRRGSSGSDPQVGRPETATVG